jgi:hypothetical protein
MKKILVILLGLASLAAFSAEKEYLVDAGTSGYLSAIYTGSGESPILELTSTTGKKYLVAESDSKVIGERVKDLRGYRTGVKVLYSFDYSTGAVVVRDAKVLKVFDNEMALIYVKSYKRQGFHPYMYTSLRRLSLKH